jgi:hypothetical protein
VPPAPKKARGARNRFTEAVAERLRRGARFLLVESATLAKVFS